MTSGPKRFGVELRQHRLARGWSHEQLAEASCLAADTIRRLERGAGGPSVQTILKLAQGLGIGGGDVLAWLDEKSSFGARVRRLREDRDWSQKQLARNSGIPRDDLNAIERDQVSPPLLTVRKLAKAFDMMLSDLLDGR